MPRCLIALGGNLGNVAETFAAARSALQQRPEIDITGASRLFRTLPVGAAAGGEFLNAALELHTGLAPLELLDELQRVEFALGRKRPYHWSPRTLDLDLILYGEEVIDDPRLQVPHPAAWYRRFVLDPLCDIAGDARHPLKQTTIASLRERLTPRPMAVGLIGGDREERAEVERAIANFGDRVARADGASGEDAAPAFVFWLGPDGGGAFESLPLVPRLDLTAFAAPPAEAVRDVLSAALDEPLPLNSDAARGGANPENPSTRGYS